MTDFIDEAIKELIRRHQQEFGDICIIKAREIDKYGAVLK